MILARRELHVWSFDPYSLSHYLVDLILLIKEQVSECTIHVTMAAAGAASATQLYKQKLEAGEISGPPPSYVTIDSSRRQNKRPWPIWMMILVAFGSLAALVILIVLLVLYA